MLIKSCDSFVDTLLKCKDPAATRIMVDDTIYRVAKYVYDKYISRNICPICRKQFNSRANLARHLHRSRTCNSILRSIFRTLCMESKEKRSRMLNNIIDMF